MDSPQTVDESVSLDSELKCSICLEIFNSPVSLPCLHSFCFECIKKVSIRRIQFRVEVICPQCRSPALLRNGRFDTLPKNTTLANIIEIEERRRTICESSMCKVHRKEYGLACFDCSVVLCTECLFPDHTSHDVRSITQAQNSYLAELQAKTIPRLKLLQASLDKKHKRCDNANKKMTNSIWDQCDDISRMFRNLRTALTVKENEVLADFQAKHNDHKATMQRNLKRAKDDLEELNGFIAEAGKLAASEPLDSVQGCIKLKTRFSQHPLNSIDGTEEEIAKIPKVYACSEKVGQALEGIETQIRSISLQACMAKPLTYTLGKRQKISGEETVSKTANVRRGQDNLLHTNVSLTQNVQKVQTNKISLYSDKSVKVTYQYFDKY